MNRIQRIAGFQLGKTHECLLCGKKIAYEKCRPIYPGCDYYNPGGFCQKQGMGMHCVFEDDQVCFDCIEKGESPVVYVGDACLDVQEATGRPREEERWYHE